MKLIDQIFLMIFKTLLGACGVATAVTGYWMVTGHCCGSPVLGVDWDSCVPYGDKMWPTKQLMAAGIIKTHCDADTWKRISSSGQPEPEEAP